MYHSYIQYSKGNCEIAKVLFISGLPCITAITYWVIIQLTTKKNDIYYY